MNPRWLALFGLGLLACDGCPGAAPEAPAANETVAQPPNRWTLGAGRPDRVALPSVCRSSESPLVTVLDGPVRIAATPSVDAALVREGSYDPVGGRAAWRPHAAGVLGMEHGTTPLHLALPARSPTVATPSSRGWLGAVQVGGRTQFYGAGKPPSVPAQHPPADLRCHDDRCALLTGGDAPAVLWTGGLDEPWNATQVGRKALRILKLGDAVEVATADDLRLHITRVTGDQMAPVTTLSTPDGVFDVAPGPAAIARIADLDPRGCSPEAGGVLLVTPTANHRLRAPLPPIRARLVALSSNAWLVVWMSPRRCGSRFLHQVYAAVVHGERGLLAPPMEVARADDFAVAGHGRGVGLWLTVEDSEHRSTVTYIKARCDVEPPSEMR